MTEIEGVYEHYKGNRYHVLGEATHSETQEKMIVYRALYGDSELWVRPATMFFETIERNGERMPRFAKIEGEKS